MSNLSSVNKEVFKYYFDIQKNRFTQDEFLFFLDRELSEYDSPFEHPKVLLQQQIEILLSEFTNDELLEFNFSLKNFLSYVSDFSSKNRQIWEFIYYKIYHDQP